MVICLIPTLAKATGVLPEHMICHLQDQQVELLILLFIACLDLGCWRFYSLRFSIDLLI